MAYFCQYMVVLHGSNSTFRLLSVECASDVVVKRLASSRAYSASGVLPSSIGIPQPHVRVVVFRNILGRHIYDRLTSMRHLRGSSDHSYIDVDCDSDTWNSVFASILQHSIVEHHNNHIRVTVTGYELLRQYIFYAWTTFSRRDLGDISEDCIHPPRSRVDSTMTFSFYGHSIRVPHLRVSFTWDRYVWNPVHHRYEGIGAVQRYISP